MYKRLKQHIESNALVDDEFVYFWHKDETIRREVRKRSSYLGSKRTTKEGASLFDKIAMTDDERDIFYSYYLNATANAYDVLSGLMKPDTYSYFVTGANSIVNIDIPSGEIGITARSFNYSGTSIIAMFNVGTRIDDSKQRFVGKVRIKYEVKYGVSGTSQTKYETKNREVSVVLGTSSQSGVYSSMIPFVPDLEPGNGMFTAEQFSKIVSVDPLAFFVELKNPVIVNEGDVICNEGKFYRAIDETIVSRAEDVEVFELLPGDVSESVVYRLTMAEEFDSNAILAIDICLRNMLVNYILWQWMMMASPDDADQFFVMYNQDKETLGSRINRSRIGATEITPRMY